MQYVQQTLFILILTAAIWLFASKAREIIANIRLGKDQDFSNNPSERLKNLLLIAFGQKKMFRNPLVALLHFVIYAGFLIINIEVLEIILDGIFGTHRMFAPYLGGFYAFLINFFEFFALGVIVVCVAFLARRNVLKLKRFISRDLDGWPRTDANYILIAEILLMTFLL